MKHYYKVTAGPTYHILKAFLEKRRAAIEAVRAWKDKHSLPATGVCGECVWFAEGFMPDKKLWKQGRKGSYIPRTSRPEGADLAKELRAIPCQPGWFDLLLALTENTSKDFMMVNSAGGVGCHKADDNTILMQSDPYWLPDDRTGLEEITASQYLGGQ